MPRHVAIIMDGNGRWAKRRLMPRVAGHKRGLETVRRIVRCCLDRGVGHLTLFAFSSENWRRPQEEVSFLMQLFLKALEEEIAKLHQNKVRFRVVGDLSRFDVRIRELIARSEALTAQNAALTLTIAANYGGRWDILNACNAAAKAHPEHSQANCARRTLRLFSLWLTRPNPISSSAPAESRGLATSCSGNSHMRNCISPISCGRSSAPRLSMKRSLPIRLGNAASGEPANSSKKPQKGNKCSGNER